MLGRLAGAALATTRAAITLAAPAPATFSKNFLRDWGILCSEFIEPQLRSACPRYGVARSLSRSKWEIWLRNGSAAQVERNISPDPIVERHGCAVGRFGRPNSIWRIIDGVFANNVRRLTSCP